MRKISDIIVNLRSVPVVAALVAAAALSGCSLAPFGVETTAPVSSDQTDSIVIAGETVEATETSETNELYMATENLDFSDFIFVGDSRTVGLFNICDKPKATFYCAVGLNVQTVFQTPAVALDNGSMGTVEQALAQGHKYSRVYINFGTNEMGWPYYDSFIELYKKLVDTIRKYSPDAKIYVESILPVTASRDQQGDAINNKNVQALNEYIKKFAADNSCTYLQCDKAVMGQDGKLPQEASPDGVHLNIDYCRYWLNYIIDET